MNSCLELPGWLNKLNYLTLSFRYISKNNQVLNLFLGPEIRGSIGHQLKKSQNCFADQDRDCKRCPQKRYEKCIYHTCFEHGGNRRKPFILKFDPAFRNHKPRFERGNTFRFDFILTGTAAVAYAPQILTAIGKTRLRLGSKGLSLQLQNYGWMDRDKSFISALTLNHLPPIAGYPCIIKGSSTVIKQATLRFLTPAEITLKHGKVLKNPEDLSFRLLITRILQRLKESVNERDIATTMIDDKEKEALFLAAASRISHNAKAAHWQNVRLRQSGKRRCGGLSGSIDYFGEITPFIPLLKTIELFNLGKNLTSGFGHLRFTFSE